MIRRFVMAILVGISILITTACNDQSAETPQVEETSETQPIPYLDPPTTVDGLTTALLAQGYSSDTDRTVFQKNGTFSVLTIFLDQNGPTKIMIGTTQLSPDCTTIKTASF